MAIFRNREAAGLLLAEKLDDYRGKNAVVLGLPRGGVVVAKPIAQRLGLPLDVLVARKIGAPGHEEFAIGAITARGTRVVNEAVLRQVILPPGFLARAAEQQRIVAERREAMLRGFRPMVPLTHKIAILVDDGIATGMTMRVAVEEVYNERPAAVIVAAPVIAPDTFRELESRVDRVIALLVPEVFHAVGEFYEDFAQISDEEVQALLMSVVT